MALSESAFFQWRNVRLLPILHNRVEFADEVRRQFEAYAPDVVAVEYPETLKPQILRGVARLPLLSVVHYGEADGALTYLLVEPADAQVEAIRLALDAGIPVAFVDRDTEAYPQDVSALPDSYAIKRIGHFPYCRSCLDYLDKGPVPANDALRERTIAYHLQCLNLQAARVLFVGGLGHLPGIMGLLEKPQTDVIGRRRRAGVGLAHLHRDSSREIMSEMPFLSAAYENGRSKPDPAGIDRLKIQARLIQAARKNHWKNSKEELSPVQIRILNKFARNYALLTGRLAPDFYQLVIAARGAADDNFAYEIWDLGSDYPWQTEAPGLPVLRLSGEDLFLGNKLIRFHRRLKTLRRRLVPVPVRKKIRERHPDEWREGFNGSAICSYPPEDVAIEGYGDYLKKRALEIKSEENNRVEPFTCSMREGLDIRETIRDWSRGTIYVKNEQPFTGRVGSVAIVFDPDTAPRDGAEQFPWRVTWLGEHAQESDMAFYSTPAGAVMDGPGISRCHYGGFMLTYPPLRVYDIWRDPFFDTARNKPERLLMAALDYSLEKHVVYVSADPPSGRCLGMASRLGKKIIYLPIGTFSPVTLKNLRTFHVLDGHHVRKYAHAFIHPAAGGPSVRR
ncbi:MAG: hypothetical protein JRK53_08025 [Deltaproteobacteria bacterium]|nr:hypothetical protein [Deltaproteobacteria bacterium]MBW2284436.1 hypothetical protein [Deltaproteobacteria bacterium]